MRHYRQTSASRDAAAERRAQAMQAAGFTPRPAPVTLPPILIDLRGAGGPHWRAEHAPGTCRWRVYDADTGARVMVAQIGGIMTEAHKRTPRLRSERACGSQTAWTERDELDAAAA